MEEDREPRILFFLGAGASVAAGVPETFQLVDEFLKDLEEKKKKWEPDLVRKMLEILGKSQITQDGRVDVEARAPRV